MSEQTALDWISEEAERRRHRQRAWLKRELVYSAAMIASIAAMTCVIVGKPERAVIPAVVAGGFWLLRIYLSIRHRKMAL